MDTNTPTRSAAITVIAWLAIVAGGLGSTISVITAAMFAVGSYGTKNASALAALVTIAGPPLLFTAGIGLLRRKRIAWFTIVAILIAMLVWQGSEFLKPTMAEDRTFIDSNGVQTTVMSGGTRHSMPIVAVCIAALTILLSQKMLTELSPARTGQPRQHGPIPPSRGELDAAEDRGVARGWRVGHRGRDQMVYEEHREGRWQWVVLDGEMQMGRAHHVIYFASAETWLRYPEWARHRRDEIIARIKSQFREPDYEYADGRATDATPAAAPAAIPSPAPQQMKASEFLALLAFVVILLGIAGGMAWLVGTGVKRGETYWPATRNSQQRVVAQAKEPVMFWTSIGVYSSIGLGALGFGIYIIRWSRK